MMTFCHLARFTKRAFHDRGGHVVVFWGGEGGGNGAGCGGETFFCGRKAKDCRYTLFGKPKKKNAMENEMDPLENS